MAEQDPESESESAPADADARKLEEVSSVLFSALLLLVSSLSGGVLGCL